MSEYIAGCHGRIYCRGSYLITLQGLSSENTAEDMSEYIAGWGMSEYIAGWGMSEFHCWVGHV